ncbi:sarcalumenin [Trichonephila clavata]|uniref:Sarcalumenin n=1 Tax=Trichonephila clavata TaxID=2740835 RepID=A0A8X6I0A5_TRICU|nr:sarcalumenin [Trichonephila clavata]
MSLCKWSCICFLGGLILIGWPATVNCESSTEVKQSPKVKDCRVHIEKALEQYWEKKEPDEIPNPNEGPNVNYLNENDSDEEDEISSREPRNSKEDLEKPDDTEDDETEESENGNNPGDENEDEDDDNEKKDSEETSKLENNEDEEDDDEDNKDEEADEDEEEEDESEVKNENNEQEDEEDEEDAEEEDESEDSEVEQDNELSKASETSEKEEDETEDDDEEEEQPEDNETDGNETSAKEDSIEKEESQGDLDESEKNEETEDDEEADEDDEEENNGDDDNDDDEEDETEEEINQSSESKTTDSSRNSPEESGQKVAGETAAAETLEQPSKIEETAEPTHEEETVQATPEIASTETEDEDSEEDDLEAESEEIEDDDAIENIYEEEEESVPPSGSTFRSREHIDVILGLDEIGTELEKEEEKLAQSVFRDIKKVENLQIKPVELLYKYADSTTRVLGDAEIFNKPMLLFLGPWSTGKTSIINYILGLERTPSALKTGTGITDVDFTLVTYGPQRRVISGTELAADWKYAGVQKFGQGFLDHFRSIHIPHPLLQKVTIIDSPGIVENKKNNERGYPLSAAFQWFIDRADAIYVVLDPSKVDIGGELGSVIEQLQGRDVRFLLNKADTIRRSDLMRVVGQLFWNLSPLMGGAEAPLIYAVSLTSNPYHPSAPAKFLADQEKNFLFDMKSTLDKRVENKILYARKHAVRVRNHAKMVDCYLASYYRHKSIFSNKRNVAKLITENPRDYNIYDGLSSMTNVSRSDVPNPLAYKEFFKIHPLYDFKPLASTCSYFRGCPMDKVDLAITKDFPELLAKYKDAKRALHGHADQDR